MNLAFKSIFLSLLALPFVVAALPPAKQLTPEEVAARAERKARFNERTGGLIEKPGRGVVVVANAQKTVKLETVKDVAGIITREFRISNRVSDNATFSLGKAQDDLAKYAASVLLFVVNDPGLPMTLVAPETHWAVVNIAPLLVDSPSVEKLSARYKRLFMRAASSLLGAGASHYKLSVMQNVSTLADLDALPSVGLDPQSLMAVMQNIQKMGMVPPKQVPYLRACQEGWAPAPTNDLQKAVWERVKAEKERGPSNPLQIKP